MSEDRGPVAIVLASGVNGLGAIRSLAERGIRVAVIAESGEDICLHSRYPVDRFFLRHSRQDAGIDELRRLFSEFDYERAVVIPTSDWFVAALGDERLELPQGYAPVAPGPGLARMLIDKADETARIGEILSIPATVTPLPDAPEAMLDRLRLPIIVKPRSFAHMCLGAKNVVLRSRREVHDFYEHFGEFRQRLIAQEVIEGPDENLWVCHATFDRESRIVSAFTFRRLRLSPPHFGVTSYAVSEVNQAVIELVARLGGELEYTGPAMVEFKWDPRDASYRYIELNPRLGLANYFDARCGTGTAYASYCVAAGLPPPDKIVQLEGAIFVSVYEDLYARRLDGESLWGVARDYLRFVGRRHIFAYWSLRDPWPGLLMAIRDAKRTLGALARKALRRAR